VRRAADPPPCLPSPAKRTIAREPRAAARIEAVLFERRTEREHATGVGRRGSGSWCHSAGAFAGARGRTSSLRTAKAASAGAAGTRGRHRGSGRRFKDRLAVRYRVAKGDSLESIAKEQLGDRKLVPAIRALNPEVDGDAIASGQFLRLPPRKLAESEPLDTLTTRVLTLWTAQNEAGALAPLSDGPIVGCNRICVLAVPGDRLAHYTREHRLAIDWEIAKDDAEIARTAFPRRGANRAGSGHGDRRHVEGERDRAPDVDRRADRG